MANSFWGATSAYLDAEFDAADAAADHDLCRAIVAGRMGLHPDGWGSHDLLSTWPPHHREPFVPPVGYPGDQSVEWKPHKPRPKPRFEWPPAHGEIQLTCDVCNRHRLGMTLEYRGDRAAKVWEIRALGHQNGWTCIAGTDRCPACSQAAMVSV